MRYIDRTGCQDLHEKAKTDKNIKSMGALTRKATAIAEQEGLGLLRLHWGEYKVIKECGLGAFSKVFDTLEEVNEFLLGLPERDYTRDASWVWKR